MQWRDFNFFSSRSRQEQFSVALPDTNCVLSAALPLDHHAASSLSDIKNTHGLVLYDVGYSTKSEVHEPPAFESTLLLSQTPPKEKVSAHHTRAHDT